MSENYVEYEKLAQFLDLDTREKKLNEFLLNSSNEYIRNQLDESIFEDEVPYTIQEAVLVVFEDKKAFHTSQNSNSDDSSGYKMSEEISLRVQDLIHRYTIKNL